jgi:AI-2 transport protein TqsA
MTRGFQNQQSKREQGLRILLLMASLVIVIAGLKAAAGFFVPVMLAFFIATVSYPITGWLRNHGVPKGFAVVATVMVDFAFLAGLVVIGITLVGDLQDKWETKYKEESTIKLAMAEDWAVGILQKWEVPEAREKVREYVTKDLGEQLSAIKVEDIVDVSTNVVGRVTSFLGGALIILLCTVFMLTDARMFGRRLTLIAEARGPNFERMLHAGKDIQRFLGIKTAVSLATGLLAGFLCWAAGLDFFILWGILAYALNYIPVMGSIIAGIPPTILALLAIGWPSAVAVGVGYCAINIFLGNFIEPMMMGHRFGMSTLVVIVSVMFWGWVWGPVGMFLAVPIMMMLKVVLENSYEFRWLAVAISKEKKGDRRVERELKEAVEAAEGSSLPEGAAPEGGSSP